MSYFDRLNCEIKSHAKKAVHEFIIELGKIETRTLKQINILIADPEFPEDIRREIQWCMCSLHKVTPPGDTPNRREINFAKKYRESKLLNQLQAHFRQLEERRVEARFGILDTNVSGMLMRRWEWEQATASRAQPIV